MFAIVLMGFARTLYFRPLFEVQPIPPYLYAHGVLLTGRYLWFILQSSLVTSRRVDLHRRFGIVGVALAVALVGMSAVSTLPPALSRVFDWPIWGVGDNAVVPVFGCLVLFVCALGIHDARATRFVQPATLIGGVVLIESFALSVFVLPGTELGQATIRSLRSDALMSNRICSPSGIEAGAAV